MMPQLNFRIAAILVVVLMCALSASSQQQIISSSSRSSCLNLPRPDGYNERKVVNISLASNANSAIHAHIVSILLDEVIGEQNNLVPANAIDVWPRVASGEIHACMEYWPSTRQAEEQKYFYEEKTVTSAGPVGIIGTIGWYMPRYVLKDVPTALSGDFTNPNVSAYFNNTFILGDKYWAGPEQKIIESNGYNLTVKVLSGIAEFNAMLAAKYAKQEPMLFFAWRPNVIFSNYDLVRVSLPNNTVYYPSEILGKLMANDLREYAPAAAYLAQSYSMNTNTMNNLLSLIYTKNYTAYDAACYWLNENEQIWENWIRPSSFKNVGLDIQISMWVLTALCIAAAIFYMSVVAHYRKSKVIIASSGLFLISMCIGGMLMFGSVAAFVSNTDIGCNLFIWMLPVGFALLFGSLFAKTGRIYLLFSNKSLQLVKYTDRDVGLGVGVILLGEYVILVAMTVVQPADYVFQSLGTADFTFCLFHYPTGITLLVYNGIVMVFGVIISILISRLRLTLYNEAKYIGLAMYNFALIAIFIAVIFLVSDVIVRYALLCCCILFITMVSLSVLFIPKIRLLFNHTEEELRQMNEAQLQAVIRSYTKKFASSSDQKNSTKKIGMTSAGESGNSWKSQSGSIVEDEMVELANSVKSLHKQVDELKKENKKLRDSPPPPKDGVQSDYRSLYEKFSHENTILRNRIFELEGKIRFYEQLTTSTEQ
eukprot:TRINITY_DN154_c0_g2_i1.p1 TRINITY_DN154_c0_g2~~TRINITY_DN154_c0_g2_i1.p1  ORF type:complete len:708 (+),score=157.53 TRINITY_DN154_c0_g2_i1:228-2351(+)